MEIKYILNRIAANDPTDTRFELSKIDDISDINRLVLDIAKAFQTNTACRTVILNGIGLTDRNILPILSVLSKKELDMLDIRGNKLTNKTFQLVDNIRATSNTKWKNVLLSEYNVNPFVLNPKQL